MKKPLVVKLWLGLLIVGIMAGCHRTPADPRPAALSYYVALSKQDWKTMYPLTAFSAEEKDVYKNADDFAQKMEKQLSVDMPSKQGFDYMKGLSAISVSPATIQGDKAEVPTAATLRFQNKIFHFHGVAHMLEVGGKWKFDTSASGTDVTAKAITQLLGQPEKPPVPTITVRPK